MNAANEPLWYKDALIYEVQIRSFFDSNNDGVGDLPGLTAKLDYLKDLGVTAIWLLPSFPSPLRCSPSRPGLRTPPDRAGAS